MEIPIFLGVDAGATSMTMAAVDELGTLVGARRGRGANPFTDAGGGVTAEDAVRDALQWALTAFEEPLAGVVVGMAGSIARPEAARDVIRLGSSLGLDAELRVVNDAETVFASGTVARDGSCLAVGTGAVGVAVRDGTLAWKVDGHGWLLGDRGSAVWIGLAGIRAVLGGLDGSEGPTSLVVDIPPLLGELSGSPCAAEPTSVVRAAHRLPPALLGRIAPLVDHHARLGDERAGRILEDAAGALGETLRAVVRHESHLPIVLGGSVVWENQLIRERLEELIGDEWPDAPLHVVRGGATGAAFRALQAAGKAIDQQLLAAVQKRVDMTQETFVLDGDK